MAASARRGSPRPSSPTRRAAAGRPRSGAPTPWRPAFLRAFSDALLPTLEAVDSATLAVLTRGGEAELARLFPALDDSYGAPRAGAAGDASDIKARLLWNFSQFLGRFVCQAAAADRARESAVGGRVVARASAFPSRASSTVQHIVLLCTYNDAERDSNPVLRTTERSLVGLGVASVMRLAPLTRAESDELVASVFGVEPSTMRGFASLLYQRTRGNPFFTEAMLKSLVDSGKLRRHDDRWSGWDVADLDLPNTVRDAIVARLERLSPAAQDRRSISRRCSDRGCPTRCWMP